MSVAGSTVTLTLATAVQAGQTVALDYTPGANPIQDAAGNDSAPLDGQAVTNNTGPGPGPGPEPEPEPEPEPVPALPLLGQLLLALGVMRLSRRVGAGT